MQTGCQGPFCHGTGGYCGCDCNCCPPPCCPVIAVYFDCGAPQSSQNPQGCVFSPPALVAWADLQLNVPTLEIPQFSNKAILSPDRRYSFGGAISNCSVPCETVCVELTCGGNNMPCCCLELLNGIIYSVGNGYVTAPATVDIPGCLTGTVYINGQPPPVFVQDCEIITVTIVTENDCCKCQQIDVQCAHCSQTMGFAQTRYKPLWRRKIDPISGKTKINPRTGRPRIEIDKQELLRRIVGRIKKSQRRQK